MDRSTLGHNLRPLERDALVILQHAPDDRRKRHVQLTPKGKALLQRARRSWSRAEDRFEAIFGKKPASELRAVLLDIANRRDLSLPPVR
jgi:DNA-binding MarR family transcriptional regulator